MGCLRGELSQPKNVTAGKLHDFKDEVTRERRPVPLTLHFWANPQQSPDSSQKIVASTFKTVQLLPSMDLNFPYLPPNPLRPRAFGEKGAKGMKKRFSSNHSKSSKGQVPRQSIVSRRSAARCGEGWSPGRAQR